MVHLVYADQSLCKLKHVVPKTDDDELSVLGSLFNVTRNDRDLWLVSIVQAGRYVKYSHS